MNRSPSHMERAGKELPDICFNTICYFRICHLFSVRDEKQQRKQTIVSIQPGSVLRRTREFRYALELLKFFVLAIWPFFIVSGGLLFVSPRWLHKHLGGQEHCTGTQDEQTASVTLQSSSAAVYAPKKLFRRLLLPWPQIFPIASVSFLCNHSQETRPTACLAHVSV